MTTRHLRSALILTFALVLISPLLTAQERTRATTPDAYKWNLTELYPSDEAWHTERARIEKDLAGEYGK
jgi:oligoendopeptidase F